MISITSSKSFWPTALLTFVLISSSPFVASQSDPVIKAIEEQGAALPITSFEFDTFLEQQVDQANKVTTYSLLPTLPEPIYTRRDTDDSNKEVVVITEGQDGLTFRKYKRIYIVLRRNPKNPKFYYVVTAIIRDATEQDQGESVQKFNADGKDRIIEWEQFDAHLFPAKGILQLNQFFCASSFLIPCAFNASVLEPSENFVKTSPYVPKIVMSEADQVELISGDGSNGDDTFDLYADLEYRPRGRDGRCMDPMCYGGNGLIGGGAGNVVGGAVGLAGGVVGAAVTGAFGIVCGVLSAILGGCSNSRPVEETVVIHQTIPYDAGPYPGPGPYPYGGQPGAYDPNYAAAMAAAQAHHAQGRRRKRQAGVVEDPSSNYGGWKTQFINPSPSSYLKHDDEVFYGFGNCPSSKVKPEIKESTEGTIVEFYLKVLRADCLSDRRAVIEKIISDKTLIVDTANNVLHLNTENDKLGLKKMGLKEYVEIASAAQLCAFTQVYQTESKNFKPDEKFHTPDNGAEISRSVNFLTKVVINILTKSRTKVRNHMIDITRYLITMLKAAFAKIDQDKQNLEKCADCTKDKEMNGNDRLQIVGLLEFVRHGTGPVDGGKDSLEAYNQFFTKNSAAIKKLVEMYS